MQYILKKSNLKLYQLIIIILLFIIIGISSARLFYLQSIGEYISDLNDHIVEAVLHPKHSYSLVSIIFRFLYNHICGNKAIAVFLALINLATIVATKRLLTYFIDTKNETSNFILWILAIVLNFVHPIILPFVSTGHGQWIVPYHSATIWYNSTYQCMKLFAVLSMLVFLKIQENYLEEIKIYHYALLIGLLTITNAIKPNFILAFAPTLTIFLTIDFFKNIKNKKAIVHIFTLGFAILMSLVILLPQANMLYGHKAHGHSGIGFGFMRELRHYHKFPILSIIQSAAFPLLIFVTNFKTIIKSKKYLFGYIMYLIALFIYLFIHETGPREFHGNFEWTLNMALMIIFVIASAIFVNTRNDNRKYKKVYLISSYSIL